MICLKAFWETVGGSPPTGCVRESVCLSDIEVVTESWFAGHFVFFCYQLGFFMSKNNTDLKILRNIRGLNCAARSEAVKLLIQQARPQIVCLQETKLSQIDNQLSREFLGQALHLFTECPFMRKVWELVAVWSNCGHLNPAVWSVQHDLEDWFMTMTDKGTKAAHSLSILALWQVWKQRNAVIFKGGKEIGAGYVHRD